MSPFRSLLAALPLLVSSLAAQGPPEPVRLTGVTFDHWEGAVGAALLRPTFRATTFGRALGSEFSLTLFPDGMWFVPPFVTVNLQAGLVQRLPLGPVSLLLHGGAAALVRTGLGAESLLDVDPGVHYGVGLVLPLQARARIRLDLARHVYSSESQTWSIGAGIVVAR